MKPLVIAAILTLSGCVSANSNGQPLIEIAPGYRVCVSKVETGLSADIAGNASVSMTAHLGCDSQPMYIEEL